jgi:tRNA-binding EMAP/Myf-like protein
MIVATRVLEISRHENADRLFVTQCDVGAAKSLQVVTNLDQLKPGDLVPLALIGHVFPAGHDVPRVKRARIRGETSEGMFVSWDDVRELSTSVSESAPVSESSSAVGDVLVEDPVVEEMQVPIGQFKRVSEIENAYQLDLKYFVDREVVVMEKMEGSSHRVGFRRGLKWCGGHNHVCAIGGKAKNDGFGFGVFVKEHRLADRVAEFCEKHAVGDLAVYGEFCGPKIQENFYELSEGKFYVFDMAIDEQWSDWDQVTEFASAMQLNVVPVDYIGIFDLEKIENLIAQKSQFGEEIPREGVVVKLRQEGRFDGDARAIFKHKPEKKQVRKSHRGKLTLSAEQIAYNTLQDTVADYVTEERVVHAIGHLREDGTAIEFPTVVRELQRDILKEADSSHQQQFEESDKEFRRIVGRIVGRDQACKALIFAAMKEGK